MSTARLFRLMDGSPVYRGDKLHVHREYWRQAGPVVTAEFADGRGPGEVIVRSDNGAVPSVPIAALTREEHPHTAMSVFLADKLGCKAHEVTRRDLFVYQLGLSKATPQGAADRGR